MGPPSCGFCKRTIGEEFHFECLACGRAYCYIHASRHGHQPVHLSKPQEVAPLARP